LLIAIDNENIEMIELLLSARVELGDALLHASTKKTSTPSNCCSRRISSSQASRRIFRLSRLSCHTRE